MHWPKQSIFSPSVLFYFIAIHYCSFVADYGRYTLVFQTGAWEFNYWPTRVVLNSSVQKLLQTIKGAKASGCGEYLNLIFLTAVPYPACETLRDPALVSAVQCSAVAGSGACVW